jgi:hypothetical protein
MAGGLKQAIALYSKRPSRSSSLADIRTDLIVAFFRNTPAIQIWPRHSSPWIWSARKGKTNVAPRYGQINLSICSNQTSTKYPACAVYCKVLNLLSQVGSDPETPPWLRPIA